MLRSWQDISRPCPDGPTHAAGRLDIKATTATAFTRSTSSVGPSVRSPPPLLPPPASRRRRRPCALYDELKSKKAPAELRAWAGAYRIGDAMHVGRLRRRHLDRSCLTKSKCQRRSG